jgi:hypothetical protein
MTTTNLLDIASYLTQVLEDSNGNAYLYGLRRIGEEGEADWQYHHGDALGSVRQLTDATGAVTLAKTPPKTRGGSTDPTATCSEAWEMWMVRQ